MLAVASQVRTESAFNLQKKGNKYAAAVFLILFGLAFTVLGVYVTVDKINFVGKSLVANATVISNTPEQSGKSVDYYPVFQFVNGKTGENVTAVGVVGNGPGPAYSVGQKVEILYDPKNPQVGVTANSFWDLWMPSIAFLSAGVGVMILGLVIAVRGKSTSGIITRQPLISKPLISRKSACQECGVKDDTVQLYVRYGDRTLLGAPLPITARYLCSNCRKRYELEDKGLKACEHCGETRPLEGSCPNCGAP